MKKVRLVSIMFIVLCLLITGCSNNSNESKVNEGPQNEATNNVADAPVATANENVLSSPVMEWWELFNPNGFNTITALITNPNEVPIDVTYDLVYYKNGNEVARSEGFINFTIMPNHKDIIWANVDIPKSDDVDDIKMENIFVSEAQETPIDGTFELDGIGTEGELYYLALLDKEPTFLNAWFVFYNDTNNNGQFDKGEIHFVANSGYELVDDRWIVVEPIDFNYTDVDVYFTAY